MTRSLADLDVLVLDCQTTGASPARGELLEVGWARFQAACSTGPRIEARLVRPLEGPEVPRSVQRVTGISPGDLHGASHPRQVWSELTEAGGRVAAASGTSQCPTVVHFARFEEPFLRALHAQWSATAGQRFPFDLICTHALSRRLLPTLPRKSLRAVAGYFGHGAGELRRARDHVAATGVVWSALVRLLDDRGLRGLDEVRAWLANGEASPPAERRYPMSPATRLAVPDRPGVYRLRRAGGGVLYVGKARSLKRRVNSYFQKRGAHAERTLEMLSQARDVDVSVTGTALEAALLEADEIKRLKPPYNVALRERGRRLTFASRDLSAFGPRPDERHSLGPFPSRQAFAPFSALASQLRDGGPSPGRRFATDVLGVPRRAVPGEKILADGLGLFFHRHGEPPDRMRVVPWLLRLGARLRRVELGREDDPKPPGPEPESRDVEWTPESVARVMETTSCSGARSVRRARWLSRLTESSLSWETAKGGPRTLVVSAGEVVAADDCTEDSPDYTRPSLERQRNFNLSRYDRMSVLTRELRSLVGEARRLELRFGHARVLDRAALGRVLVWV